MSPETRMVSVQIPEADTVWLDQVLSILQKPWWTAWKVVVVVAPNQQRVRHVQALLYQARRDRNARNWL